MFGSKFKGCLNTFFINLFFKSWLKIIAVYLGLQVNILQIVS